MTQPQVPAFQQRFSQAQQNQQPAQFHQFSPQHPPHHALQQQCVTHPAFYAEVVQQQQLQAQQQPQLPQVHHASGFFPVQQQNQQPARQKTFSTSHQQDGHHRLQQHA